MHLMNCMAMKVRMKFDSAHRLARYDGKCRNLHGHTYHLEVTVSRDNPQEMMSPVTDMVTDFGDVKAIIKEHVIDPYDHAYISIGDDPLIKAVANEGSRVVLLKTPGAGRSTAEVMVIDMANRLTGPFMKAGLHIDCIELWETETSSVKVWNSRAYTP